MPNIGFSELLLILCIILLLFGAKNIPEIARSLGKALGAFKQGTREGEDELKDLETSRGSKEEESSREP